ncbi:hypothetical protein [Leptolinea tardivitalis]|uniref:Nucleotidyltransferase n=1 Tax=Leptolinea tardivitalis TaxID=229920 RepID=A0A0P6XMK0_9CHLR|nr:hypothetical protein [Leptolinea tardivitalis]KPL73153.1 hypothetical protein ADM99_02600 [Leptolinea tardivitalis]GAP21252.1 hypothetical protein LTAR_01462 [Leptolinea tardivitalis]
MFQPDFLELLKLLNEEKVEYLIVGGYAVAAHGHPRFTRDLDIWVNPTIQNGKRIVSALDKFGFHSLGLKPGDFTQPDTAIQLGYPPLRVVFVTEMDGLTFKQSYPLRVEREEQNCPIYYIDLISLITNKKSTGREQDLEDAEFLSHMLEEN